MCWLRARRPTVGSFPPAAQQTLSDIGLGGFIAAIGLANGPAAIAAIQSHGVVGVLDLPEFVPLLKTRLWGGSVAVARDYGARVHHRPTDTDATQSYVTGRMAKIRTFA